MHPLSVSLVLASQQVPDFAALRATIETGAEVRAVIHYRQCTLEGSPGPDAIGGMSLWPWELFEAGAVRNPLAYVAASETRLIHHPSRGWVQNYVKVRIFSDDHAEVTARYLDPRSLKVVMDETFHCDLKQGLLLFTPSGPG